MVPCYRADIIMYGSIYFQADDDEDAAKCADALTSYGSPVGADIHDCEVNNIVCEEDE